MIMNKKVLTDILRETGGCPKEYGLKELECSDCDPDINCTKCWDKATEDVERIEFEA